MNFADMINQTARAVEKAGVVARPVAQKELEERVQASTMPDSGVLASCTTLRERILAFLKLNPKCSCGVIAARLNTSNQSVQQALYRLMQLKLVDQIDMRHCTKGSSLRYGYSLKESDPK